MLAAERRAHIVEILGRQRSVTVGELSKRFRVAQETIRRDLKRLEGQGVLKRTHGGAVLTQGEGDALPLSVRIETHQHEKDVIARAAAELICDGDTVLLDAGSTTMQIARRIRGKHGLVVVTNALNVAMELAGLPEISVNVTGGCLRGSALSMIGPAAEESLSRYRVDKAFVAASAVNLERGLAVSDGFEAQVKAAMVRVASRVCLVVDSSKFCSTALVSYAPIDQVDVVITDEGLEEEIHEALCQRGIEVILASDDEAADAN